MNTSKIVSVTSLIVSLLGALLTVQGALPKTVYGVVAVVAAVLTAFNDSLVKNFNAPKQSALGLIQAPVQSSKKWLSIIGLVVAIVGPLLTAINPALGVAVASVGTVAAASGGNLRR